MNFYIQIIYALLFSLLSFSTSAATLHAIFISDTNDSSIGLGAKRNHQSLKEKLQLIEQHTSLSINLIEITGSDITTTTINRKIAQLSTASDDVIWFYYSGHAVNSLQNQWPRLLIQGSGSIYLDKVFEQLKKQPHRLLLVIGDCCNIGGVLKGEPIPLASRASLHQPKEKLIKLFEKAQGNILAASSSPTQASGYLNNIGGIYTSSFIDGLNQVLRTPHYEQVNWNFIFTSTANITQEMAKAFKKLQNPLCIGSEAIQYNDLSTQSQVKEAIIVIGTFKEQYNIDKNMDKLQKAGYEVHTNKVGNRTKIWTSFYGKDSEIEERLKVIKQNVACDAILHIK